VFANELINAVVYCTALYVHRARNEQADPSAIRPHDSLTVIKGGAKGPAGDWNISADQLLI
jgi:hypothetical protein